MTKEQNEETDQQMSKISDEIQLTEQCVSSISILKLKQMELEAATLPSTYKKEVVETIKSYKREMNQVEKDFRKLQYDQQNLKDSNNLFDGK